MFRCYFILSVWFVYLCCFIHTPVHAKLLGYWAFDDKKEFGKDSSKFGNDGEPKVNAAWTEDGKVGGGLKLDGSSWLEVPHDSSLNATDQVTLMCWVQFEPDGVQEDDEASLIYKNGPFILPGDQQDRRFWASYSLVKFRSRKQIGSFAFEANTTGGRTITAPGDEDHPEANEWFHVAAVADGAQVKIYTNGVEKASAEQKGEFRPTEQPLTIGFDLRVPPERGGAKPYLIGIIDEVVVLDHALTSAEINEAMNLGENGKSLADFQPILAVEARWKLATKWAEIKAGK